jgi:hypothetical protein
MEKVKVYCPHQEKEVEIELSITEELTDKTTETYKCPKWPLGCGTCQYT